MKGSLEDLVVDTMLKAAGTENAIKVDALGARILRVR
jgi:hypothetical protein